VTPDQETVDWIFEASRWWLQSFGGFAQFENQSAIVLPTPDDFPVDADLSGHELAEDYFEFATEHAGLSEWPFELIDESTPNVADALRGMPHHMTSAPQAETEPVLIAEGDPLAIPYDLTQLKDPVDLVATMARGMSHYLLYHAPTEFPADPDDRAYFVDLGAVFLGFGVFLANSAFRFEQTESGMMIGWGFARRGALSQLDVTYVLALTATLLDASDREVRRHLAPNPSGFFKSARKHIAKKRRTDLDRLRRVPSLANGPYR
jgi:hypothetical protein